jgi:hypothetical protein
MGRDRGGAMKKVALLVFVLAADPAAAASMTVNGPGALALAAVVAPRSRIVGRVDQGVLARLFSGRTNFRYPANRTFLVSADKIDCRVSNVDIIERSCELTFGTGSRTIRGRDAHELFATLAMVGVPPDGAAGTIHEGVMQLLCTIDPNAIKQKDGSGATCKFDAGP